MIDFVGILDPGTRHAGVALFDVRRVVVVEARSLATNRASVLEMVVELGLAMAEWPFDRCALLSEWPRKYQARRDAHEDVDGLQEVVRRVEAWPWVRTARISPHGWKGNVPKRTHHARIEAALSAEERAAIGWDTLGPDGRDAVGMGQWALSPRGVYADLVGGGR